MLSKINLAQQYYKEMFLTIQIPTEEMIVDSLTKPKSTDIYVSIETASWSITNYWAQKSVLVLTCLTTAITGILQ